MTCKSVNTIKIFFVFILYILGLNLSDDFGISWDENVRRIGSISHGKEVAQLFGISHSSFLNIPDVNDNIHAWKAPYGMIFEFPALLLELITGSENTRDVFLYRHKLIFTFHFLGVLAFFFFSKELFITNNKALLSTLVYSLHPRIFAHGFFNPKDIIFLAVLTLSLFPIIKFFKTNQSNWLIISSIIVGLAMSCRIVGIYIPFLIILFYFIIRFTKSSTFGFKIIFSSIPVCVSIILISFFTMYLFTPYYWSHPIDRFIDTFQIARQFSWPGNIFFFGDYLFAKSIPWYYLPVWISITTPIVYLIFFVTGILLIIFKTKTLIKDRVILLFSLIAILIPYLASVVFQSTLYDGWRHFYFVYPFITIVICYSIFSFYKLIKQKIWMIDPIFLKYGLTIVVLIFPLYSIISCHPFQQVYFNSFAGSDPMINFEGDYWGVSYRKGLEYIVTTDRNDSIFVKIGNHPGSLNRHILKKADSNRLIYEFMIKNEDSFNPDYYITNFRESIEEYKLAKNNIPPFDNEIYAININGMKILGVYKY